MCIRDRLCTHDSKERGHDSRQDKTISVTNTNTANYSIPTEMHLTDKQPLLNVSPCFQITLSENIYIFSVQLKSVIIIPSLVPFLHLVYG